MNYSRFGHTKFWSIYILLLSECLLISCTKEENALSTQSAPTHTKSALTRTLFEDEIPSDFFFYSDTAKLGPIITTLQTIDSEFHFKESFSQNYGTPLWDFADITEGVEDTCYYVPIYDPNFPLIINSIWFFYVKNELMSYIPIRRNDPEMLESGQQFIFNLMSYLVFGEKNASGFIFEKKQVETRAWVTFTECWRITAGTQTVVLHEYWDCRDKMVWVETFHSLTIADPNGGSGDNYPMGSGDGGGSGNTGTGSIAKDIFKNDNLPEDNWDIIEALLELIEGDCMGNSLYNGIKRSLNGDKITFLFTESDDSNYNPENKTFSLNMNLLESNVLFHEMWHIYQSLKETAASFQNAKLNLEIEAHYAQYLYLKNSPEWEKYEDIYKQNERCLAIIELGKTVNNKGDLVTAGTEYFLDVYLTSTVIPIFREVEEYNNYSFDANRNIISNFSNMKIVTKNCN